jgi:4-oxalocrotonate tautomerase
MCGVPAERTIADTTNRPTKEDTNMPLIQVKALEGVFTQPQKQEIIERLTHTMVEIEGENMRQVTVCIFEEVASGDWGIGGQTITTDDAKALARGELAAG